MHTISVKQQNQGKTGRSASVVKVYFKTLNFAFMKKQSHNSKIVVDMAKSYIKSQSSMMYPVEFDIRVVWFEWIYTNIQREMCLALILGQGQKMTMNCESWNLTLNVSSYELQPQKKMQETSKSQNCIK